MSYVYPTYEHQYAPAFSSKIPYSRGQVVKGYDSKIYKFRQACAADSITVENWLDYVFEYTPQPLPNPSRPLKEGVRANTIIYAADSGHEQRREKSNPRRTFDLTWNALTLDQYLTLRDFYMVVLNSAPFMWTHPIENTRVLVRFANDVFQGENVGHGPKGPIYKLQVSLLQVWS